MTERKPVDSVLEPALDEAGVARVWRRLGEQRAARARTKAARLVVGVGLAAGAVAAVVVALIVLRAPGGLVARGEVSVASGASVSVSAETAVPLDDGSTVTLARGTTMEVLSNDGERFVTVLRGGRASYEVKPGGPRKWVVETDLATIEVVGTGFDVERDEQRGLTVSVRHGVVMVRGERVPGRVQRLVAGARLTVEPVVTASAASSHGVPAPAAVPEPAVAMAKTAEAPAPTVPVAAPRPRTMRAAAPAAAPAAAATAP